MESTVKWTKNLQSIVDNGRGHQVVIDMPEAKNGDNQGATALELAAMSLTGCIATIFAVVAAKMRIEFTKMEVELDASKTDADTTITKVDYIFRIRTNDSLEKIEKCLKYTMDTCPVGILFEQAGIPVKGEIIIF